ncbi:MAG: leucine-rich repeat protein [bacterium]
MRYSRMLFLCIGLTLFIGILPARALTQGPYTYTTNTIGQATITDFDSAYTSELSITNVLGGCPVTSIGVNAFSYCAGLTGVVIPNSVTSIRDSAFYYCTGLTNAVIGSSVTSIGDYAFDSCDGLTNVVIGSSVTSIGDYAFFFCTGLASVVIPNSVTSIGDNAFYHCTGLAGVMIPNSVISIGNETFTSCTGLTAITVGSLNTAFSSTNGVLFNKSQNKLVQYPGGKTGTYAIPESVTSIGDYAFRNCTGLTSVVIPTSVTSIGDVAFFSCTGLTSVVIPTSVTSIGEDSFGYCTGLTNAVIGSSVTSIGDYAFSSCTGLTGVYFKGNAPFGSSYVFNGDDNVTVYRLSGASGWPAVPNLWCGRPTALWYPVSILTVVNGAGGGSHTYGQQVTITANAASSGKIFDRWTGATQYVASVISPTTFLTMPASDITLTATYADVYTLTVNNGTGTGSYTNGQQVAISADVPLPGKRFDRWTGAFQYVASVTASNTVVTTPASNITVTATYVDVYSLTVSNGTGGGSYTNGQQVTITANAVSSGKIFDRWTGATQYVVSVTSPTTLMTMPASDISLTATYSIVYPGFDIANVKILCKDGDGSYSTNRFQPLLWDDVGVEAALGNMWVAPSNIQVYVTYYIGTNVWGADNWPTNETFTKPLYPTLDPLVYRTSTSNDIRIEEPDEQAVQYRVWATYEGGLQSLVKQETFDNPSWYYPVDLNQTYQEKGWSPYYIVYGTPPGAVWINEVNAIDYVVVNGTREYGVWDNPYIEIAVPAGVDLAGWKIDLVTSESYETQTITIPAGLPPQTAVTNGYAFFVIGEHPDFTPSYIPPLPKLDYKFPGFWDMIPRVLPGGVRLRRPMGMCEQAIAYDWNATYGPSFSGTNWVADDPEHRFVYVGREHNGGSLGVTNGTGAVANDWVFPNLWTPGLPNAGQHVPFAEANGQGITNILVTSAMNIGRATQNGKRTVYYNMKLWRGSSKNVVYKADDWYRIYSVQKNQVEQLPPGSALSTYTLGLVDVQTNIDVAVTLGLRQDIAGLEGDPTLLNWLTGFEDAPLAASAYGGRGLMLNELYWLNADPTVSNRLEFLVTDFNVGSAGNFNVSVRLALNSRNVVSLQGNSVMKLEVKQGLADTQWSLLAQYALNSASFDTNHASRIWITDPFHYLLRGWDPGSVFCRGMIEMEDPRVQVQDLFAEPLP